MTVMTVMNEEVEEQDPILAGLQDRITKLRREERALQAQVDAVSSQLKRYERALKVLQGEPLRQGTLPQPRAKRVRKDHTRISTDRLEMVRSAILEYSETHEEFRQVDIRGVVAITSSVAAVAFEELRQENVIRFARKDGNNKYYRLTRGTITNNAST